MIKQLKKSAMLASLCLASASTFAQFPTDGLIRKYPFTGTVLDYSRNDAHGSVNNVTLSTNRFNEVYSAYSFSKSEQSFIELPSKDLELNEYTYSLWAYLYSYPEKEGRYTLMNVGSTNGDFMITYDNVYTANGGDNRLGLVSSQYNTNVSTKNDWVKSGQTTDLNIWNHIVVTKTALELKIYVNGILRSTTATTGSAYYGSGVTRTLIGKRFLSGYAFDGKIDDLYIYNRAITDDEVRAIYEEGFCKEEITVTDELVINLNVTGFSPLTYENTIKMYPNPATDQLNIDFGDNFETLNGYSVKVTDDLGKVVYNKAITSSSDEINLQTWSGVGLYIVHILDENGVIIESRKIILQ